MTRYNLVDTKYCQMVFQSKVSGDCQRETTHEVCCLAVELKHCVEGSNSIKRLLISASKQMFGLFFVMALAFIFVFLNFVINLILIQNSPKIE